MSLLRRALLLACVACFGAPGLRAETEVVVEKNVAVPMRDGVKLRADVRRPTGKGPFPVLVFRTPYDKGEGDADNESTFRSAVKRGYAVVVQDVRGRFASEGEFVPYFNEGRDGYDTIEWAAAQPWSDGKVGTFGLSYPGAVQWLAAVESPPHLKAMVPAMCFSTMRQAVYFGGIFEIDWIRWCHMMAPETRVRKHLPGPRTYEEAREEFERLGVDKLHGHLPTLDLPYLKGAAPYYYDWISHPPYSRYWDFGDLHGKYSRVKAAVLNLSGWHDEPYGPEGATTNHRGLDAARAGQADPRTRLLLGPWVHGVEATKDFHAGNRTFDRRAAIDYDAVVLDFLDLYVRGIDRGLSRAKPVRAYVMGSERWIESDAWPLKETKVTPLYLGPPPARGNRGTLGWKPFEGEPGTSFVADPSKPVRDDDRTNFGAYDLRKLSTRKDVLTFDSEPLTGDLTVVGTLPAEVYMAADAPDCDLFVKLLDVAPDGTAFNLMSPGLEGLRASYRDGTEERKLLKKGQVVKLTFPYPITGNTFKKGHRLRVCITASWYPIYSRNLQTGEPESTSARTRPATITIFHDAGRPSRLLLPVIPEPSKTQAAALGRERSP